MRRVHVRAECALPIGGESHPEGGAQRRLGQRAAQRSRRLEAHVPSDSAPRVHHSGRYTAAARLT